jgi:hypothetical protein
LKFRWSSGENAVQEGEVILDGLAREAAAPLVLEVAHHVLRLDLGQRAVAEVRRQVPREVAAVVLDRRRLAFHDVLEVIHVAATGLAERQPATGRDDDGFGFHAPPHLAFGLSAGQSFAAAGLAHGAEGALDALVADPPPPVPLPVLDEQGAAAIGALRHDGILADRCMRLAAKRSHDAQTANDAAQFLVSEQPDPVHRLLARARSARLRWPRGDSADIGLA